MPGVQRQGGSALGVEESMDYSSAVGEIWRHHDLSNAGRDYVSLVRYATLAASSHNTQPWKFKL